MYTDNMASQAESTQVPEEPTPANNDSVPVEASSPPTATGKPAVASEELPSEETQGKVEQNTVLDREGKAHPFKSVYSGPDSASRVLVIFVRHFFCGVSSSSQPE